MPTSRMGHTVTLLNTGLVLAAGGATNTGTELFDPDASDWYDSGNLTVSREGHTATLLDDGSVLIVGGSGADAGTLATTDLYRP